VHLEQIAFNFNDSITAREKKMKEIERERERKSEKKPQLNWIMDNRCKTMEMKLFQVFLSFFVLLCVRL
jgi:hypothetical protein